MDENLKSLVSRGLTSFDAEHESIEIGNYAFASCKGLEGVANVENITRIGDFAFHDTAIRCDVQEGEVVPVDFSNVESIGNYAFWNCHELEALKIGSCKEVGVGGMSSCTSLVDIDGMENLEKVGTNAFHSCKLKRLDLPKVRNIKKYMSKNNTALETASLDSARTIDDGAFEGCTSLGSAVTPNVERLGTNAFKNCSSLTVFASKYLKTIGEHPFEGCTSLEKIYIGGGTTERITKESLFGDTELENEPQIYVDREHASDFEGFDELLSFPDAVGGYIFDLGGAKAEDDEYHFFDRNFVEITGWSEVADLEDAMYYTVSAPTVKKIKVATLLDNLKVEKCWGNRSTPVIDQWMDENTEEDSKEEVTPPTSEEFMRYVLEGDKFIGDGGEVDESNRESSMWAYLQKLNDNRFKDIYLIDAWADESNQGLDGTSCWYIGSKEEYDTLRATGFFDRDETSHDYDIWSGTDANWSYGWKYYHWEDESEWGVFKALCELYLKNLYKTSEDESEWGLKPRMYHTPCADFLENNDSLDAYKELKNSGLVKLEDFDELMEYPSDEEEEDSEPQLKEGARITPLMCIKQAYDDCMSGRQTFTVDPYFITWERDYYGEVVDDSEDKLGFYKVGNTNRFKPETQTMQIITFTSEYKLDGEKNILPIGGTALKEETEESVTIESSESTPRFKGFLEGKIGEEGTFEDLIKLIYNDMTVDESEWTIPNDDDIVYSYEDEDGVMHEVTFLQDLLNIPTKVITGKNGEYSFTGREVIPCRFNNKFMLDWGCKGKEKNTGSWYKTSKRAYANIVPIRNI